MATSDASRQAAAYNFFIQHGWSPVQAAGILGGLNGETSNLNTTQSHDNGIGYGIAGWNGPRLTGLYQFARQNKESPSDLNTQLGYVDWELRHSEAGAGAVLGQAQNPAQAGQATLAYFRPKDWNVPGAHPERAQNAQQVYGQFGAMDPVASIPPISGPQNGQGTPLGTGSQVSSADAAQTQNPAPAQPQGQGGQPAGAMPAYPWTPQVGGQAQPQQPQMPTPPPMMPALTMPPMMRPQINYQALRQALANLPAAVRGYSFPG